MYKLCFYVPKDNADEVKKAVFEAGGGRIGNYDSCCWQTEGKGQFRPLKGSNPHIGVKGQIEVVVEIKVELVVEDGLIREVLDALKQAHPYEEPAYDVVSLTEF